MILNIQKYLNNILQYIFTTLRSSGRTIHIQIQIGQKNGGYFIELHLEDILEILAIITRNEYCIRRYEFDGFAGLGRDKYWKSLFHSEFLTALKNKILITFVLQYAAAVETRFM